MAALIAIVVAGAATIATTPAPHDASAEAAYQVALTDERPFDVRRIGITLVPGDREISRPLLNVGPDWHTGSEFPPSLLISIIPEEPGEPMQPPVPRLAESLDYISHDLSETCRLGCERSYLVVAQRTDPGTTVFEDVLVSVTAYADANASPLASAAARRAVATVTQEDLTTGEPLPTLVAEAKSALAVNASRPSMVWRGSIVAPAAARPAEAGLASGAMWIRGRLTYQGEAAGANVWVTVNGTRRHATSLPGSVSVAREWLSECELGVDCTVPIEVELIWSPDHFSLFPTAGAAKLEFTADARLTYLSASQLPAGASLDLIPAP